MMDDIHIHTLRVNIDAILSDNGKTHCEKVTELLARKSAKSDHDKEIKQKESLAEE
ncbi:MAG: hypothetical protein MK137_06125 [Rickettsiales bacterium]|nr:hypothetical protein [Rickettsiales bacterium]